MSGEWESGNIYIRPMCFDKAGAIHDGHEHNFDHTSIVFVGSVRVKWRIGEKSGEQDFYAPAHFLVRANVEHQILGLEDGTIVWCVYSHRAPQGAVTQQNIGWTKAYG